MIGIARLGTYFPRRRLDRGLLAKAWGGRASGTRTMAAPDEDALTMAVEALAACVGETPPADVGALYFASTSAPYLEKQVASMIATAADLPRDLATADFGGSVRAGLGALRAALDAVGAGSVRAALVAAADCRLAEPGSELETQLGDGAAAALVGRHEVIAELVTAASVAEEFTYFWRTDEQRYVQVADARFGNQYGVQAYVPEALGAALRKAELPAAKLARVAVALPDPRAAAAVVKKAGLDPEAQLVPSLAGEAGVLGCAEPMVLLSRALEGVQPGDFVAMAAYGEGADAMIFRATHALRVHPPRPIADALAGGIPVPSYERYLRARGILPFDVGGELVPTYIEWKELKQDVRLWGSRCTACGLVQYPQEVVCMGCHAPGKTVEHKLRREGTVFTFTIDHLIGQVPEHPMPMVVVELDGGGRVYLQGTDCAEGEIAVGKRVRLTYRRLHQAGGNRNYFWKVRPA
ncbi:MAG TPA: OB-fold domain-containing protein [Candidatus Limnocylindria bacterium]|nr:OB-fold domain-containing protein [Candidatus Limnocylindria bacterium]